MDMDLEPFAPVSTTPAGHRILDAATWLFREQGITATGVDSIAERASTTKRTLYQRFDAKDHLDVAPHWALFPGGAIFLTVLSINFIGDGLRDALDPRRVF